MVTPVLRFAPEVLLAAQDVRVVFFNVDVHQRFNTLDGHGLKLLHEAAITPVVITGRDSKLFHSYLATFGVAHVHGDAEDKVLAAEQSLVTLGLDWTHAASIGHDWPDLPLLTRCAFAAAPADAHIEVRAMAHHVTAARGDNGAVRELCDLLLTASGRYARALAAALRGPGHA
jgi:3-deoxy-D-manno-octulosonate 8-phosphate phosphatase (KDO 8-P phosphatase)